MGKIRQFETGATRDTADNKNDYEGFISPLVLEEFGNYMTVHRKQTNGELRDSDNWQKGMPKPVYMKSLWRHFLDLWKLHRGYKVFKDGHYITIKEACCAIMFNVMGYMFEEIKENPPVVDNP